ncbi:hypothetical protein DY000_02032294 [Brassica cretica]|uniref:Serine-threonine/tyrosine-protein kinase catalytic domain-containing protein n=1 Tax=Brassica cretica TaxID=69181 RepID=A0ABQ7DUA7_BRACR|nr:hypothetical protein DY000_02032294 [Brassica cretica]
MTPDGRDLQISLLHHILYTGACDDGDLSHQDFRFEDWSCFSDGGDTFPSFLGGTQRKERGELTGVDMPHTHEKVHCSQEIIFAVEVGILGCVRHKNLLSARGYCAEGQERLIVYGLMKIVVTSAHAIAVGVLLLEQVTGKRPIERLNQTRYTEWFSPLVYEKKYGEIVDQKLNEKYVDEELERVIFVRLMCAQSETESRPTISEVVEMLMNNLKEKMATTH